MIVVKVAISLDCSFACSTPVRTVTSSPSSAWIRCVRSARASCPRPPQPERRRAALPCRGASAPSAGRRSRTSRRRASSGRRTWRCRRSGTACAGPSAATPIRSPSCRSSSSATPSSTATSSPPLGQRPSTRLSGLKRSYSGCRLDAEGERRRAARVDRLSVRPQQLRLEVLDRARGDLDPVDAADLLERLLGDRRRLG